MASYTFLFAETDCHKAGSLGKCIPVENCEVALQQIKKKRYHDFIRCGFKGRSEIICCPSGSTAGTRSQQACKKWLNLASVTSKDQIVGGKDAELGEFPHMAALGFYSLADQQYYFHCGGSLISERYVLTAAHCIVNSANNDLKIVRLGAVTAPAAVTEPDQAVDYNVDDVKIHEKYDWKTKHNDIALVKLEKSLFLTNLIRPACLYLNDDDPEKLYVTGWGKLGMVRERSEVLQKAALKPRALSECNSTYLSTVEIALQSSQICAADVRVDSCQGDSGGPLQVPVAGTAAYSIVGVISYGLECGSRYPGVYTRVYSYVDWIENIVWP